MLETLLITDGKLPFQAHGDIGRCRDGESLVRFEKKLV